MIHFLQMCTQRLVIRVILSIILVSLGRLTIEVHAAAIVVNSSCTLDNAIRAANQDAAAGGCPAGDGADSITLNSDANIMLANHRASTVLSITSPITIVGNGHRIHVTSSSRRSVILASTGNYRLFQVSNTGTLTLNSVTIGWFRGQASGGAISNEGTLTINNSIFHNNTSGDRGGAIYSEGTLTINSSSFLSNYSADSFGAGRRHCIIRRDLKHHK